LLLLGLLLLLLLLLPLPTESCPIGPIQGRPIPPTSAAL